MLLQMLLIISATVFSCSYMQPLLNDLTNCWLAVNGSVLLDCLLGFEQNVIFLICPIIRNSDDDQFVNLFIQFHVNATRRQN